VPGNHPPAPGQAQAGQITAALRLVWISVIYGMLSGTGSVIIGVHGHSLSVLAIGLGVLADVTGSATLIWRFAAERGKPRQSPAAEARAALVVAVALATASAAILAQSAAALATGSRPGTSNLALIAAGISLAVLTPLAYAKRRLGGQIASRALQGDGTLSGIGAVTSLFALTALALYRTWGWWWPDPAAALAVAAIAAAEAWHTAPRAYPRP
jgi:divalent metal cation (Fe/Co/Zn/Cd) transporter